jgi:hypothetical protein
MEASQIYILISIIVLLVIAILVFFIKKNKKNKREKRLTPLAGLAFAFIILGIIFGDDRLISYSFIGTGVLLAIVDIAKKLKK